MINIENERLTSLFELSHVMSQMDNYDAILKTIIRKSIDFLEAEDAHLELVNPTTQQTIKTVMHSQSQDDPVQRKMRLLVSGWILKNNHSCFIPQAEKHELFKKTSIEKKINGSILGLPLRAENRLIGALILTRQEKFEPIDLDFAEKLMAIIAPFFRDVSHLQKYFAVEIPIDTLRAKYEKLGLYGKSPKFIDTLKSIDAVAHTNVRVLLEGESGTGKELVARAIHTLSRRHDKPFVAIDCGAIPPNLIESELFGHVRGAFTGANTDRKGLMEEANHGTLFLDEIASLPLDVQAKLLRVLQEGEIKPVGSNKIRQVDVRIIAASSQSLKKLINEKAFREDLFYRLYVYPVAVPSLAQRSEDIPRLANHFLQKFALEQGKNISAVHPAILDFMKTSPWKGNIRELENCLERLVTLTPVDAKEINPRFLPADLQKQFKKKAAEDSSPTQNLNERLAELEEQLIRQALVDNDWNQSKAARTLGISEYTMRYKMTHLGIKKPAF